MLSYAVVNVQLISDELGSLKSGAKRPYLIIFGFGPSYRGIKSILTRFNFWGIFWIEKSST